MIEQKICILCPHIPPYYAGAGKRALKQARYLANRGFKIVFISVIEDAEHIENIDMVTVVLPAVYEEPSLAGALCRNLYHPILFLQMLKIIKTKRFKILHCIPAFSWLTFAGIIAAKILGVKVITEPTLEGSDDPIAIRKSRVGRLKYIVFKLSDAIVSISPLISSIARKAGLEEEKLHLIPNGVNHEEFNLPAAQEKQELRDRFGLSKYNYVFIYVGVMRPRKGVLYLLEAFKLAQADINNCCLVLAGPIDKDRESIDYYNELKKRVDAESLTEQVIFTGQVNNIAQWLKSADVFLFASVHEGLPNVVIEAMSTGLPVIARHIPQTLEYIFNNKGGIIVDDITTFSRKMVELIDNKELYNRVSVQARNRVMEAFRDVVVMEQYVELYRELLK